MAASADIKINNDNVTVTDSNKLVINEVLFYVTSKFEIISQDKLKLLITSFYKEDELSCAKDLSNSEGSKLIALPRYKQRKGDNKLKVICDDIFEMLHVLDESKLLNSLPTFVASKMDRIPLVKIEDIDVFSLIQTVQSLELKVKALEVHLNSSDCIRLSHLECQVEEIVNAQRINSRKSQMNDVGDPKTGGNLVHRSNMNAMVTDNQGVKNS